MSTEKGASLLLPETKTDKKLESLVNGFSYHHHHHHNH